MTTAPDHFTDGWCMTSDGDALLRAICEAPWEDTPRLVYADWLQENGQPERAEFIRLQIELDALPRSKQWGTPQYDRASKLEMKCDPTAEQIRAKIARKPKKPWSADLPTGAGVEWGHSYVRGFRNRVTFNTPNALRACADAVMAAAPVDDVTVKRLQPLVVSSLLALPWVARLKVLHLSGNVGAIGAEAIAHSPNLARLEYLDLSGAQMTDTALKALAGANLPNLTRLGLAGNTRGVTETGLNALLNSKTLKKLKAVNGVRYTLLPMANAQHIYTDFYKRFPNSH